MCSFDIKFFSYGMYHIVMQIFGVDINYIEIKYDLIYVAYLMCKFISSCIMRRMILPLNDVKSNVSNESRHGKKCLFYEQQIL